MAIANHVWNFVGATSCKPCCSTLEALPSTESLGGMTCDTAYHFMFCSISEQYQVLLYAESEA